MAEDYAELIQRCVDSCDYIEEPPHYTSTIEIIGTSLYWKDEIRFRDGYVLDIIDSTSFYASGGMKYRSFSYDFRKDGEVHPVFRIDNHNRPQPATEPCHLHLGANPDRIECFPDSTKTDFQYVVHCIKNFYASKPQDWERP